MGKDMEGRGKHSCYFCLLFAGYLLGLLFDPEDGGDTFLRKVSEFLPDYTALHFRR
jgi:hypothetical protein